MHNFFHLPMSDSIVGIIPCLTTPYFTKYFSQAIVYHYLPHKFFSHAIFHHAFVRTQLLGTPSCKNPHSSIRCDFACWCGTHGTTWRAWASLVRRDSLVFGAVTVAFIGAIYQECHCRRHIFGFPNETLSFSSGQPCQKSELLTLFWVFAAQSRATAG